MCIRDRLYGVPDFNYATVIFDTKANINCDMMRIVPLVEVQPGAGPKPAVEKKQEVPDPQVWYEMKGRAVFENLIADLNSRAVSYTHLIPRCWLLPGLSILNHQLKESINMKLNNRFLFGILSILLAAIIAFVALPTISRQTNGKTEIVRVTQPVLKGAAITDKDVEIVEVGSYNLPSNIAVSKEDVVGRYAAADLAAGDYILSKMCIRDSLGGGGL